MNEGVSWPTLTTVTDTSLIQTWLFAKSDNKKIAISWIEGFAGSGSAKLQIRAFDGTTLSTLQIIATESSDNLFDSFNNHAIAINNMSNVAAGLLFCNRNANADIALASFFNTSDTTLPTPTILQNFNNIGIFSMAITLNNVNRALLVWNNITTIIGLRFIAFSAQYIPSAAAWENILSRPQLYSQGFFVICNNDNGDAVSFFSPPPAKAISISFRSISYAFFLGSTNKWKFSNPLFSNNEFIKTSGAFNNVHPFAFDCKHASSNLAFITPSLNTLACCGSFSASQPTDLQGSCCLNRFPMQAEFFAQLQWNAPTDGEAVAGYNVYRNNEQIAALPSTQLTFSDHNRPWDAKDTYDVSSVDNNGIVSVPAEIIVHCTQ